MSGGGGSSTTVQKSDPWSGVLPYLSGQPGKPGKPGYYESVFTPGGLGENGEGGVWNQVWRPGEEGTPAIPGILPEAQKIYEQHTPSFFKDRTYAGFSPEQQASMRLQTQRAFSGSPLTTGAQSEALNTVSGGYLNANPAMRLLGPIARGWSINPSQSLLNPIAGGQLQALGGGARIALESAAGGSANPLHGQAGATLGQYAAEANPLDDTSVLRNISAGANPLRGTAEDTLRRTAAGEFLTGPGFDRAFQAAENKINPQVDSAFASAGRLGSGLASAAKTEALGNAFANLYGLERQNQLSAANQLGQFGQAGIGNQLAATSQLTNVGQQNIANRLGAAGQLGMFGQQGIQNQLGAAETLGKFGQGDIGNRLSAIGQIGQFGQADIANRLGAASTIGDIYGSERGRQLAALGIAPGLANQDYFDISQLGQVGAQRQAMEQAGIDDAMARHEFEQNLPYYRLGQYQNFINPILGVGGSSTATQPMYRNRFAGGLGGALAGAQLGSAIPGLGTAFGAGVGGLLGML